MALSEFFERITVELIAASDMTSKPNPTPTLDSINEYWIVPLSVVRADCRLIAGFSNCSLITLLTD